MVPHVFRLKAFAYCLAFAASERSGYRTVTHNRLIGGVAGSPHVHGVGVDVVYDGARPGDEADTWLASEGLRRIDEQDHDHLQPADWVNRPLPV
ncbi:MAG TPA: D-Ala-D-Ala carboxypeptidase family metallohydrolase [Burkholderiales bacterium]